MIAGDCPLVAGCVVAQASNAALHRLVIALDATEDAVAERTAFLRELAVLNNPLTRCGHYRAALVLALARLHVLDGTVVGRPNPQKLRP